jgi:hypothetical protein
LRKEDIISELEHEELLVLFQVTAQDISFFKSQQWTLTNYTLVAFAAIVGIPKFIGVSLSCFYQIFLSIVAVVLATSSLWIMFRLKKSIDERRDRLNRIYDKLSYVFLEALGNKQKVSTNEMFIFLCVFILCGLVVSIFLLSRTL